jgi:hypothetical protein
LDVALVEVDGVLTGANRLPPGLKEFDDGALHVKLLEVMTKEKGSWWIAAFHNVGVYPLPPGGMPKWHGGDQFRGGTGWAEWLAAVDVSALGVVVARFVHEYRRRHFGAFWAAADACLQVYKRRGRWPAKLS